MLNSKSRSLCRVVKEETEEMPAAIMRKLKNDGSDLNMLSLVMVFWHVLVGRGLGNV